MATKRIRNLDDETYAVLRRRAAEAGQSLEAYLRTRLEDEARQPTIDELLRAARAELTSDVSMKDILAVQNEGREE
ncbi:FitA-like ribbon-helix-helix domain-containing protein [Streptomyces sp. 8N616]|uniref:FitA-like ribbon-helix-helix domain-containing protein n=1 Tax=Streptomyces sp. 8N616 TaxID=3457414 RepID=UPI003FD5F3B0